MIDAAMKEGWNHRRCCEFLQLKESRAWRWRKRQGRCDLGDRKPGGGPVHGLLDEEVTAIIDVFNKWSDIDRLHRNLAHRGSYIERFWVSPSTVKRVLDAAGLRIHKKKRTGRSKKQPFPEWVEYTKNCI